MNSYSMKEELKKSLLLEIETPHKPSECPPHVPVAAGEVFFCTRLVSSLWYGAMITMMDIVAGY